MYGWKDFSDVEPEFAAWGAARSWTSGDGPKTIFADGVGWLRERKVLLPGVTTPARLVAKVHDDTTKRLWGVLDVPPTVGQRYVLNNLVQQGVGVKVLERHRGRRAHRTVPDPRHRARPGRGPAPRHHPQGQERSGRRPRSRPGRRRRPVADDDRRAAILDRRKRGESIRTIAAGVNLSVGVVHKPAQAPRPRRPPRGDGLGCGSEGEVAPGSLSGRGRGAFMRWAGP